MNCELIHSFDASIICNVDVICKAILNVLLLSANFNVRLNCTQWWYTYGSYCMIFVFFAYLFLYSSSSWSTTSNVLPFSRKSALISASQPDSQASATTATPRDTGWCTTWYACLLPSFRWYQIILLGDRGSRVWTTCLSSVAAGPRTRDS